ncbi:MAG TPA: sensor domain-containing diguanylate cyclase [Acidimicrobiia bacterium]|jgi:diguanylate cyclase (GGDEF)-like protein/PAS domain S-box-containing protein
MSAAEDRSPSRPAESATALSARRARRRAFLAVFATVPLAAVGIGWFRSEGWVADTPLWVLAVLLLGTAACNLASIVWLRGAPNEAMRIEARLGVSTLATTAVIYAIGWGPMLIVAYGVGFAVVLQEAGSTSWRSGFAWSVIGVFLGQSAIQVGWAPTLIDTGLSNAVALGGLLCFGVVARVLGVKTAAAEDAEDALRDRGEQFFSLLEHAVDVIAVVGRDGELVFASPAVDTLLGYAPEDVVASSIGTIVGPGEMERLLYLVESLADHPGRSQTLDLVALRHRDGSTRWVAATLTNPPGQWGDGVVINMHDVTKQRELEEQLRHDALHDPLTGLWNRPAFAQYAEKACARASRDGSTLALLFVDLDGFKQVNDTLGHGLGDEVLIEVAKRLRGCIRGSEVLARLGGDEFTVLIERVSGSRDAIEIADRIHASLTRALEGPEGPVWLGASVGIALSEQGVLTSAELLRDADHAMYMAKRSGRSGWKLADPGGTATPVPH